MKTFRVVSVTTQDCCIEMFLEISVKRFSFKIIKNMKELWENYNDFLWNLEQDYYCYSFSSCNSNALGIIFKILCVSASAMTSFPALKGHCYLGQRKKSRKSDVLQLDGGIFFFCFVLPSIIWWLQWILAVFISHCSVAKPHLP